MYKIVTVELQMGVHETRRYADIYIALSGLKKSGGVSLDMVPTVFVDMGIHRRLCFALFHMGLDNFYKSHRLAQLGLQLGAIALITDILYITS